MRDREVTGTRRRTAADQASIDLHVSVMASGFAVRPSCFACSLTAAIEARRVVPPPQRAPLDEVFTVAPEASSTVYTAEIPLTHR